MKIHVSVEMANAVCLLISYYTAVRKTLSYPFRTNFFLKQNANKTFDNTFIEQQSLHSMGW